MKKWSISAHNCFQICQRKYFFNYIMAHHNAKDLNRREAYLAKQLSSLDAWKGKLVHLALEKYFIPSLEQGNLISIAELEQQTFNIAQQQLEFSRQRKYQQKGITKSKAGEKYLALKIHENEAKLSINSIENVFAEIKICYQHLYKYQAFIDFLIDRVTWYMTELRLSFKLDRVTIVGQPDLLVGYGDRQIEIIDWKTGKNKSSDYSNQLYLYGLTVINSQRWSSYQLSDLLLVEASLYQNKFNQLSLDKAKKIELENFVRNSINNIKAVTGDRKYNLNDLKNYQYAENSRSCEYCNCNFKSICQRL